MSPILDVFVLVLLFFLFGYSHSLLASENVKEYLRNRLGRYFLLYRFTYNLLSLLSIWLILKYSPRPDIIIYDLAPPFDILIYILQLLSLAGIIWSARYMNLRHLAGTDQLIRFFKGDKDAEESKEKLRLKGPYLISRHPVYLFSILFLGLRPQMDLFYFVSFLCITIYFYIGSVYEEKKLLQHHGEIYQDYINKVPRIFPSLKSFKITNYNQV